MNFKPGQVFKLDKIEEFDYEEFSVQLNAKVRRQPRWQCVLYYKNISVGMFEILEVTLRDCFKINLAESLKGMANFSVLKVCKLKNTDKELLQAQQLEIILFMNWEKIHKTMKALKWTWGYSKKTPSKMELITSATRMLNRMVNADRDVEYNYTQTGGFKASRRKNILELEFIVADWDGSNVAYK